MSDKLVIYTDGGARGNPGPAGIGVVIWDRDHLRVVDKISRFIGHATNNQAEYHALLAGLQRAKELQALEIDFYLDSELLVKQLRQEYRVKDQELASLFTKAWNLAQNFKKINYYHVPREKNKEADKLVNLAIDAAIKEGEKLN